MSSEKSNANDVAPEVPVNMLSLPGYGPESGSTKNRVWMLWHGARLAHSATARIAGRRTAADGMRSGAGRGESLSYRDGRPEKPVVRVALVQLSRVHLLFFFVLGTWVFRAQDAALLTRARASAAQGRVAETLRAYDSFLEAAP